MKHFHLQQMIQHKINTTSNNYSRNNNINNSKYNKISHHHNNSRCNNNSYLNNLIIPPNNIIHPLITSRSKMTKNQLLNQCLKITWIIEVLNNIWKWSLIAVIVLMLWIMCNHLINNRIYNNIQRLINKVQQSINNLYILINCKVYNFKHRNLTNKKVKEWNYI